MKTTVAGRLLLILAFVALAACGRDEPAEEHSEPTAEAPDQSTDYSYQEGTHFVRFDTTHPTIGDADMIEVAEVFLYSCPHCNNLEPELNRWAADLPDNVRFVRIPATWSRTALVHAQIYYTMEVLVADGTIADGEAFHAAVFDEYHNRRNQLLRPESIEQLFARFDVDAAEFDRAWNSPEVAEKLRIAQDLGQRYLVPGVPTIVVNGKYRTSVTEAGNDLFNVVDELIAREAAR